MDNQALLTRQQLLFGMSPDEAMRQTERERAKDDARRRTLNRFRDYAENNNLPLLLERVEVLRSTPRAQPAAPVTDNVSLAASATGGVAPEAVTPPSEPEAPVAPPEPAQPAPAAPVEPPVAPPAAPEAPTAPEVPATPPTPPAPETPAPSAPESPSEPEVDAPAPTPPADDTAEPSEPEAPTAASLVDNSAAADDGSSDDTSTNDASDNEV